MSIERWKKCSHFIFLLSGVCYLFILMRLWEADQSCYGASNICWMFLYQLNWYKENIKAYEMSEEKLNLLQNMS